MSNNVGLATGPLFPSGLETSGAPPTGFLSPEELILFVENQVGNIDDQIRSRMADIERRKAVASKYQEVANRLKELKGLSGGEKGAEQDAAISQLKAEIDALAENDPAYAQLKKTVDEVHEGAQNVQNDEGVGVDWLEGKANVVSGAANEVTSTIELDMLRLQGLIQQRTQCMTFVSNVLASMNEANKTIIGNTRG
jgi:hypothetical protein